MVDTATERDTFNEYRSLLFAIAYRMVGSVMDAEDIVQEAYLRWQRRGETDVQSPKAYLSAIVTRLSIDHLRAAHVQRETYVGPWLPEPLVTEVEPDVAETAALHESLSMAFLVLLETLTPLERAIFLLHDVFGYDFREIAGVVEKSEANCRQLAHRARQQIHARRPRFDPAPAHSEQLTRQFIAACTNGDLSGLLDTLADDVTLWSDGGGKTQAATRPVSGADRVAAFLIGVARKAWKPWGARPWPMAVNGQPGFVFTVDGQVANTMAFDFVDGRIQAIRIVLNPDKLRTVTPPPGVAHDSQEEHSIPVEGSGGGGL
jgi:RNA polymerase sigma-70 factor (ECF subfamily)